MHVREVCETGRWAQLEEIKRHADPHAALRSLPGIGATLAERQARILGAAARRLGLTRDWVVIYYSMADGPEGQRTVVTETHGPFAGLRVIRGHEAESTAPKREKP